MFNMPSDIGLSVIRKVSDLWRATKSNSLVDYTAPSRVEPIALIDADCLHHELLPDTMQSLQSIFSGYYLQAFSISMNVGKIEVMRHLDRLNPNRDPGLSAADTSGWLMAAESYKNGLPRLAQEAINPITQDNPNAESGRDTLTSIKDLTNLSVGKMIAVNVSDGNSHATINIAIRLMATYIPTESLTQILSYSQQDKSTKERYHGWKSGRLEFVRDILFCQDLIEQHKKNLKNDSTGIYGEILNRERKNRLATIVSGNPSIATASNLLVCSKNTLERLEGEIGGSFKDYKTRQKIFNETNLMIIAVIDKEWDRVTFYTNGINTVTQVGRQDLKASNKANGPDVAEIMKQYMLGSSPSL